MTTTSRTCTIPNASRPSRGPTPKLLRIEPEIVALMRSRLPAQTNESISATFGISQNTWIKIRDGHPIRRSVGERLLERLADCG
jgi:hypothetical protein